MLLLLAAAGCFSSSFVVCLAFSVAPGTVPTRTAAAPLAAAPQSRSPSPSSEVSALVSDSGGSAEIAASSECVVSRRSALLLSAVAAATLTAGGASTPPAFAEEAVAEVVEMKSFVDPEGLFLLNVPKRFYTLRRKAKGDLPDEKTGKGRRGSSIFTAGDMAKAEVVAVERFPTAALLEESGIVPMGDLSTFPAIGKPAAVAELINARRERERQQSAGGGTSRTNLVLDSAEVSEDGKTLTFRLRTKIDVQKPELLLEQTGVSELYRITLAKCTLDSGDGNIMAVFASAIETDYDGPDGEGLRRSVDSFRALDRSGK